MHTVICPVCWHEETFRAIQQGTEPCHDDASSMRWQRPGGWARVQICTMWDGGYWRCGKCGIALPPHMAAVLIDAVLRVSDPDSDSYDRNEKTFEDAMHAAKGGPL